MPSGVLRVGVSTGDGPRLPGAPDEEGPDRVVCHVDMDCFYAACERLREPGLEGEPLVVGMGYEGGESHGAVATASYEAREFGVESAMPISEALERLPRRVDVEDGKGSEDGGNDGVADEGRDAGEVERTGHYRPVDMEYYESVADEVKGILHDLPGTVREVSIDEAYLDVTPVGWDETEAFAADLKGRIEREVGVVASVGVAPNMSAAKIASDHDKPDGLVVVRPGEVREFLAPLDVEALHGVGPVTAGELRGMGVETAGDLAVAGPAELAERFGRSTTGPTAATTGRSSHRATRRASPRSRRSSRRPPTPTGSARRCANSPRR